MKKTLIWVAVVVILGYAVLRAQTGIVLRSPVQAACPNGVSGMNTLCSGPDGWYGGTGTNPLTKMDASVSQGTPGPQGPIGPAGPQGPAGVIPTSITCTSITVTLAGIVLTGCH